MLHIIWSIIVGFFIGLIARAIMPGGQHMGFFATSLVGIAGSIVGWARRTADLEAQGRPAFSSGRVLHVHRRSAARPLCS
jgi:uncharacterized membrane protein YeaQ/YmgE (transglycosylase-associated protein family)